MNGFALSVAHHRNEFHCVAARAVGREHCYNAVVQCDQPALVMNRKTEQVRIVYLPVSGEQLAGYRVLMERDGIRPKHVVRPFHCAFQ